MLQVNLFQTYFNYVAETESPLIYHRWSLITCIGAYLGRRFWLPFGPWKILPNHYVMLIGNPGARKNAAISLASGIIDEAGYKAFSANKTRLEKFLIDLEGESSDDPATTRAKKASTNIVMQNIFGPGIDEDDVSGIEPREVFICAPEFNTFMPRGDIDFIAIIGDLWDWDNEKRYWKHRLKNSKQVHIYQPTISVLGGNTHAGFQDMFPPQSIGQGFLSRVIHVYSEPSGKKISFPDKPPESIKLDLIKCFITMREKVIGAATITPPAKNALDIIYRTWHDLEDQRFKHYSTRRFTHLLKLTLICTASRLSTKIDMPDVLLASSLLSFTESFMPKALGEFGKSRNAEAANKIMQKLYETKKPLQLTDLWKVVNNDLEKMKDLGEMLSNLMQADKIQSVPGKGFLPKQKPLDRKMLYVDYNILKEYTQETK